MATRGLLALLFCLPGACGPTPRPEPPPAVPMNDGRPERGDEIVALYNGEPLTWRAVADKTLELALKESVDQYVRWRIVEDRRKELGIVNTPGELSRRAETFLRQFRKRPGWDDAAFQAELTRQGLTEEGYIQQLAGLRFTADTLILEKIVRYHGLFEDTLEIERTIFSDESDARAFADGCRDKGFDRALEGLVRAKTRGRIEHRPREAFARDVPPIDRELDPWIVEALLKLKPGDVTGVESGRSGFFTVIRLLALRRGNKAAYPDVQGEVLEGILKDPPREEECKSWIEHAFRRSRLEYRVPATPKEKARGRSE